MRVQLCVFDLGLLVRGDAGECHDKARVHAWQRWLRARLVAWAALPRPTRPFLARRGLDAMPRAELSYMKGAACGVIRKARPRVLPPLIERPLGRTRSATAVSQ